MATQQKPVDKRKRNKSAEKRAREAIYREAVNRARRSRMRSAVKSVERAIEAGDKKQAQQALVAVQPELDRAVSKRVIKRETASRKLSRLAARVGSIAS
jgi:small subunit ribosomal protein S20